MLSLVFKVKRVVQTGVYAFMIFVLLLMMRALFWRRKRRKRKLRLREALPEASTKRNLVTWSDAFTFGMLIMYVINGTVATLNTWYIFYPIRSIISCKIIILFMWITLQYCRVFLYLVIITRINLAFHDSCYRYSHTIISTLYFIVFLYMIGFTYVDIFYSNMDGSYHATNTYPDKFCNGTYNEHIVLAMLLFDIAFSVICLYLFIKPLMSIIHNTYVLMNERQTIATTTSTSHASNRENIATYNHITDESPYSQTYNEPSVHGVNDNFTSLVVKYTNLSFICMLSTCVGLLVLILAENTTTLITIDNMFICSSIVLMSKFYEIWYFKLCTFTHRFWLLLCTKCCMDIRLNGKGKGYDKSMLSKYNNAEVHTCDINNDDDTYHSDDERAYLTD